MSHHPDSHQYQKRVNCCLTARVHLHAEEWLTPESEVEHCWMGRLRLYRCPSCGQLWVWRNELVGHQEWDVTWRALGIDEALATIVADRREEDERRQSELKLEYEALGLEWPTGRRRNMN